MADSETEISKEELQKEIAEILQNASLDKTSTKKVIQKLEKKLGMDLSAKKKLIDQLVMDYVNSMDSDGDSAEEEPLKPAPPKKMKKETDDDDEEERDDSNDSDWGYHPEDTMLLDESSDEHYQPLHQESTISTSLRQRHIPNQSRKAVILQRVSQEHEEDECDIFGKLTAKKLRRFPEEQRDSLIIELNQFFYEKSHGKPTTPPMPLRQDRITIGSPNVAAARHLSPTHIQAKKIYRLSSLPKLVSSTNGTNNIPGVPSPTNDVPSGNNMPIKIALSPNMLRNRANTTLIDEKSANKNNAGYCQIM